MQTRPVNGLTVLIVDDDRVVVARLARSLQRAGYRTVLAYDGAAALALLEQGQHYDAVILDRIMPGLDGLQVLQHMKGAPSLRAIPVVMATGMDRDQDIWEGVRNGAFYYLTKPLDLALVAQVLEAAICKGSSQDKVWAGLNPASLAYGVITRGVFRFQTLQQCEHLAGLLANSCPDPKRASVGLYELMINALEHGNLGITYAEKTALVEDRAWEAEVERRQGLPENRERFVTVTMRRHKHKIRFEIQDMGQGFPWRDYLELDPGRILDNHGRGILLARWETFSQVKYLGDGSRVVLEISLS